MTIFVSIFIFYFILNPDPGIIIREMVVNLVDNICTHHIFENLVDDVLFRFQSIMTWPEWACDGERWDSEAGIICIFADTMSRKYKIYLSGQSPSLLCPQGTGDKVIISTEPGPGPGRPPSLCPQHQTRGNSQHKMRSKILTTKIFIITIIVSLLRLTYIHQPTSWIALNWHAEGQ